ncbi:MAG: hypothetical protein ACREAC_29405, partial [Blastocatellia bacterium]
MKKSTAAMLSGCLIGLVVYVSVLSVALVRDLNNSTRPQTGYSSSASGDTSGDRKLEVAATNEKADGRTQAVKISKHHHTRAVGHRQRIKAQKDGVT